MAKVENNKDDKGFELPGGVFRGGDYFRQPVEARREASAVRIRAQMPEDEAELLIISLSDEEYLSLPPITTAEFGGTPVWMPRYDKISGKVDTNRWIEAKTRVGDEGQALLYPQSYKILRKPSWRVNVDLESFPKSWTVARLIPQEVWEGIESALRQQDEVRHDYGIEPGPEQEVIEELLVNIHIISDVFREEEITEDRFDELGDWVESILAEHGINYASGEVKQRIKSSFTKAKQKDSIERINPLVARTYLLSAYLDATRREVTNRLTREKASKVYEVLFLERAITRANMENAILVLDALGGFGKEIGEELFVNPDRFSRRDTLSDTRITSIRQILHQLVRKTLDKVKVAPYLLPARLSKLFLVSMSSLKKEERIFMQKVLHEGGFDIEYDPKKQLTYVGSENRRDFYSVEDFVRRRKTSLAPVRLWQARQLLASCLEDPDNSVYRVF